MNYFSEKYIMRVRAKLCVAGEKGVRAPPSFTVDRFFSCETIATSAYCIEEKSKSKVRTASTISVATDTRHSLLNRFLYDIRSRSILQALSHPR